MTHYEILGVRKTATTEEIKDAYKKLVKKYHPDVYVGDKTFAEKKIKEINEAYDVLSDATKKSEYDALISPHTTTTYSPPDYESYTYNPSYTKQRTSKRKAQAQGSKYSYENYKKTYTQNAYDYQRRYTDYHRSKTPNSNYSGNNPEQTTINKDAVTNLSTASKLFIVAIILIFYFIFLVTNLMQLSDLFGGNDNKETPSTEAETESDYTYTPSTSQKTYEDYFNDLYNTVTEEETITEEEEFDINTVYSDSELREVYNGYFTQIYPTFEEFKQALSDYYYQTYYQDYY